MYYKSNIFKDVAISAKSNPESIKTFDADEVKAFEELVENKVLIQTKIKVVGACTANPNDKFTPYEKDGYGIDEIKLFELYGVTAKY